jgi:hypothetical protein
MRNGYTHKQQDDQLKKSNGKLEDDEVHLEDFANLSYNQLADCVVFLEKLYKQDDSNLNEENHKRAIVAVFGLEDRFEAIVKEFDGFDFNSSDYCDGGVSTMIISVYKQRLNLLVATIISKLPDTRSKAAIFSMKCFMHAVASRVGNKHIDSSPDWRALKKYLLDMYL